MSELYGLRRQRGETGATVAAALGVLAKPMHSPRRALVEDI
jgi:hypothetical protein